MIKTVLVAFLLAFTLNCAAPVKKVTKPVPMQVLDNDDVTDMLIWLCFNRSDGTDAALEACGGEY